MAKSIQKIPNYATITPTDVWEEREQILKEYYLSTHNFPTKPSSDGYYHINITDPTTKNGRRQIKAKTIEDLREKVYQYDLGLLGCSRKTFKDAFEIFQREQLKYVKDPEKLLSIQNTCTRREYAYNRFIKGTLFEQKYMDEITHKDIEALCIMNLDKYDLKKKAFDGLKNILSSVFALATSQNWTNENAYLKANFKNPRMLNMIIPKVSIESRGYTDEEITRIIDYLHEKQASNAHILTPYALELLIHLGLRRGEVCPLIWSDFEKDGDGEITLIISKELLEVKKGSGNDKAYDKIVDHTKTWRSRKIPINDEVEELLRKIYQIHVEFYPDSEFLFPARDKRNKTGCMGIHTVYEYYRKMCKTLGIQTQEGIIRGPHAFRRNACTDFINESGGDAYMASMIFGNSPQTINQNYFTTSNMRIARETLNKRKLGQNNGNHNERLVINTFDDKKI